MVLCLSIVIKARIYPLKKQQHYLFLNIFASSSIFNRILSKDVHNGNGLQYKTPLPLCMDTLYNFIKKASRCKISGKRLPTCMYPQNVEYYFQDDLRKVKPYFKINSMFPSSMLVTFILVADM